MNLSDDYIAGLFDGEGTIGVYKYKKKDRKNPKYMVIVALGMTDRRIAKYLYETFGGSYIEVNYANPRWKTQYRWRCEGQYSRDFLLIFESLLVVKREQAKLGLKMALLLDSHHNNKPLTKTETKQRDKIVSKMKKLNKRGR